MLSDLLTSPRHVRRDCRELLSAVKKRWDIPDKDAIVKRLFAILNKETVTATNAEGDEIVSEAAADRNAAAAAKVLLALEAQNQADEHHNEGSTMNHVHSVERRNAELSMVSAELGIDPGIIGLPTIDANSSTPAAKELSAE